MHVAGQLLANVDGGKAMTDYELRTIQRLREEAQETGHCVEFRDQCRKEADKMEQELQGEQS